MKIPTALTHLNEISRSRSRPDDWLKNAYFLHGIWKVNIDEAVLAVDSHWQACDRLMSECCGTNKDLKELSHLELAIALFHNKPTDLFKTINANPSLTKEVDSMGSDALDRLTDRTTKAQKIAKKAQAKIPRTWRTSAIFLWTNTWESCLPTPPPMCLLSDTAISELFTRNDEIITGESIRQEINRGLNLYRPTTPRYGIERRRDQVKFVLEHSGKVAVTRKL
jgi:hypothetical protein